MSQIPPIYIILYSEYSVNSKRIMDIINTPNVSHIFSKLEKVCIDNEQVRSRVMRSKKIEINKVPCILIIYQDGGVEKFDGSHAFKWVEEIIQTNLPKDNTPTNINNLEDTDNFTHSNSTSNEIGFTPIDDLKSDDESEIPTKKQPIEPNVKEKIAKKPPKSIRTDVGNYEFNSEFGDNDETLENRNITSGLKSATSKDKGLIATAQAMQKARDSEISPETTV